MQSLIYKDDSMYKSLFILIKTAGPAERKRAAGVNR